MTTGDGEQTVKINKQDTVANAAQQMVETITNPVRFRVGIRDRVRAWLGIVLGLRAASGLFCFASFQSVLGLD